MTNLKNWKDVWRTVRRDYDQDGNGYVAIEELDLIIRSYFEEQLEGKSMFVMCKKTVSDYDHSLVNYKQVK